MYVVAVVRAFNSCEGLTEIDLSGLDPFSLEDLAHNAMVSRTCYIEKFKHLFKLTPFEYIRKLRVNHALELLSSTDLSVADIAQACGFSDSAHMIKVFKEDTGLTPTAYRRSVRNKEAVSASDNAADKNKEEAV